MGAQWADVRAGRPHAAGACAVVGRDHLPIVGGPHCGGVGCFDPADLPLEGETVEFPREPGPVYRAVRDDPYGLVLHHPHSPGSW